MRLLLDTCTFLWIIADPEQLSATARALFSSPSNEVFLSPVSIWEMSVKFSLGRLPLPDPPDRFIQDQRARHGILSLPLDEKAVLHLHKLPAFHRDPFDRMLVCQAIEHDCAVLTPDPLVTRYPVRAIW